MSVPRDINRAKLHPTETSPLLAPPLAITEREVGDDEDDEELGSSAVSWEELRILTKYTLPVFVTHVLEYSLVMASVVSIGHISTTALAGITLGSMTASVSGFSILHGFASALDTVLPPAWTSSQPKLVGLWSQRMMVVMAVVLLPIFVVWFMAENILLLLKQEPEIAHLAATYLKWVSLGLPAYAFNLVSRRYFQSQGLFAVPTRIILIVAPINVILNVTLVWGPAPIRLGFIGAPLATAFSFNLVSLMSAIYGVFFVPKTAWHPLTMQSFVGLGTLLRLGLSGVGQVASEWWSWELVALLASLLGPIVLASQSILLASASMTYQAPFSLSIAAAVRVGNLLGERKANRAASAAKTSIVMALAISTIPSTVFLVFRNSWAYLFNSDPVVVSLVASILPLVALFQVFDGMAGVAAGILRASGRQFTGAVLNVSAYYVIGIPFGIWLAFKRDFGLHGLWIGLSVALIYSGVLSVYLCLRTNWDREVEKAADRLAVDSKRGVEAGEGH